MCKMCTENEADWQEARTHLLTFADKLEYLSKTLCGDCGKEYEYTPEEVLRIEMETPASLKPHPLFR